ncbi:MAG: aminomethyl-transferring glycine dehydrogenase subunit GcvPA [Candidatus Bipolaricaulota bacterium]|nr:aminomethyl-transferring glycine dehydrogenase subunit GcvPA [Candidatus Bipolaricaulota bacterium]MDW8030617.1 aminomethyl-transferring glycine dehydrogenase subunit GcvPA [Candidatus Bipolaricaulota bacterium]
MTAFEFIPNTLEDQRKMLAEIGLSDVEELFVDIPAEVLKRFKPLGLKPISELEVSQLVSRMASENAHTGQYVSFLGGGIYDHYVPAIISHLISRGEFLTCYTPYQAELSQGTLTWMFEFQTMICELTAMEVANSSMYDGGSALAEAMLMAKNITGRKRFLVSKSLNPHHRRCLETYAWGVGLELIDVPFTETGQLDRAALQPGELDDLGGLIVQTPNFFGVIEDLSGLKELIKDAFLIVSVNPISLGLLAPPGLFGADIVVGEGQPLGIPQSFGGPLLGIFATRMNYVRRMPGRMSGRTVDADGRVGYVMALQTREQHIRREKATSNICTNQALMALCATIYMATLGRHGLRKLAELNLQKAHYLAEKIAKLPGFALRFSGPFFNEFVVRTRKKPSRLLKALRDEGFLGGLDLESYELLDGNNLLVAVTEKRTRDEMDRFVKVLKGA